MLCLERFPHVLLGRLFSREKTSGGAAGEEKCDGDLHDASIWALMGLQLFCGCCAELCEKKQRVLCFDSCKKKGTMMEDDDKKEKRFGVGIHHRNKFLGLFYRISTAVVLE